ncbi:MAG: polyribonucleotide nucleotidyltransferase [Patescibacteria group bacterium]|nr:polyribonucleotide nucleotidyltransferase [Patescibacteria group bacterium]
MKHTKEFTWDGKKLKFEVGALAFFADASVRIDFGDTTVLATAVVAEKPRDEVDYLPLLIDYEEKFYASGKISGSRFIKREGRPSEQAILNARMIDRPIRPLFPKSYRNDVQVVVTILSYDPTCPPEVPSIIAASLALSLTRAPFEGPVGAARVGLKDNEFILNPSDEMKDELDLDFVVVGTNDRVMMIEGEAREIPDEKVIEAISWAHDKLRESLKFQEDFIKQHAKDYKLEKEEILVSESDIHIKITDYLGKELKDAIALKDELERQGKIKDFEEKVLKEFEGNFKQSEIANTFNEMVKKETRKLILEKGIRPDNRKIDEIRTLNVEVGVLPRTHGSAIFSRGQTQVLSVVTLDAPGKQQSIETMEEEGTKHFMHHYNFPPFSSGEVKPIGSPSRREIGHGALAEKAIEQVVPAVDEFPYTIRVVSEVLSSNGSTSMASTCASILALMDAGVPIKNPVAGIAMGLVAQEEKGEITKYRILTDIQGLEDFSGDMDFKVAGTKNGVTAVQMDTKIHGLNAEIIKETFAKAKKARELILDKMLSVIPGARKDVSEFAPSMTSFKINPDKIRDVIGSGGKTIREIIEDCGVEIDVEQDGSVFIASPRGNQKGALKAEEWIKNLTREVEVGEIFDVKVVRIADFGAFVELWSGQDGLIHISEFSSKRIDNLNKILKVGDQFKAKVIKVDESGKVALSVRSLPEEMKKDLPF